MPNTLMDMFTPRSLADNEPIGFGDAIAQNRQGLIGLGMGLLQPISLAHGAPAQSPWGNALGGYQHGAQADAASAYRQAQLAHTKRQEAFQRAQALRSQSNADRAFAEQQRQFNLSAEGGKVPPGWMRAPDSGLAPIPGGPADPKYRQQITEASRENILPPGWARTPDGGMTPIPGGPADPKYVQQTTEAKAKPREFSVSDVTKLSEEGGKFANLGKFTDTFEPRFAGYKAGMVGDLANLAGRNLPEGVVGKDIAEGATWWQGYDSFKNVARHELYGGALTPGEIKVFEAANISPGMDPKQIEKNLATQKEVVQNGLKRKANALIASGYDPKAISQAYGVDLSELGVTAIGRRDAGTPPTAAPSTTPPAAAPATGDPLAEARDAIKRGAPKAKVIERLAKQGIRFNPKDLD